MSNLFNTIMRTLKTNVMDYSDIEAPYLVKDEQHAFVTRNGGFATMFELAGAPSHQGIKELSHTVDLLYSKLSKTLENPGYQLDFVFIRDKNQTHRILEQSIKPAKETLRRLEIDLESLLDERQGLLSEMLIAERCFVSVKTLPLILPAKLLKKANKSRIERAQGAGIKPGLYAQSPYVAFDQLFTTHDAFCSLFENALKDVFIINKFKHREAIHELKMQIEPYSTGSKWQPSLLGDKLAPKLIQESPFDGDLSSILNPDIATQMFSRKPETIKEDPTTVKHDHLYYTPLLFDSAQAELTPFQDLFDSIPKNIPWRLNITIESGHNNILRKLMSKKGFATFLRITNSDNGLIKEACEELLDIGKQETLVAMQASICTWAKSYEDALERKELLAQAVQNWGGLDLIDEQGDPIESWLANLPMFSTTKLATPIPTPLSEVLSILPFTRPASPWETGTVTFNTPDGKPFQFEPATAEQGFSSDLTYAPPGCGKSFGELVKNLALICKPGNTRIPRIKMIDIGFTSAGFVSLIREALPDHLGYLAQDLMLENSAETAINMFQTPLGNRYPLSVDRTTQASLMELLLTPAGVKNIPRLPEVSSAIIDALYKKFSDDETPNIYEAGIEPKLDEKLDELDFKLTYSRSYWEIVDFLMSHKEYYHAALAHKYAMPLFSDVSGILNEEAIRGVFGKAQYEKESLLDFLSQMAISAMSDYPILTQPSVIDVSSARILSLNLQNVAKKGSAQATKQTAVMYMLARSLACFDAYWNEDFLPEINSKHRDYFRDILEQEAGMPYKIVYDEFHRTGGITQLQDIVEMDIREGRKFKLMISLLSQRLEDFTEAMREFATSYFILNKAINEETPRKIEALFNPGDGAISQFKKHVRAPNSSGSSMLFITDAKSAPQGITQVLKLRLGAKEIWAYSTSPDDVALRRFVVKKVGLEQALTLLSNKFPNGSAENYIDQIKKQLTDDDTNAIITVANEITSLSATESETS
ncbi:hypothetical protein AB4254_11180 [Vibrio breoganii]